jgi:molecular chaperone DnaK
MDKEGEIPMDTILGIDLGTTNSEVAVIRNGQVEVLGEDGEKILPSVVGLDVQGRLLVGTPARNQWVLAPDRTIRSIKRKMGEDITVRLGDQTFSPQEISAVILRTLKQRAERQLGHPVCKAVITVPAFFNETQREATREAGELAGLDVVRILNEPTAASLTYEAHPDRLERLLVYDLGGGTFDVSIVQIERDVVEVLASHGDTHLGGDDFDQLLLDLVCDDFAKEHGVDLRQSLAAKSRVLRAVEEAKKRLSDEALTTIDEEFIAEKHGQPLHLRREIARDELEELIEPLLAKTLVCVDQSLSDARLHARQIDKVILVGGASRTPLVRRLLEERLGQPVHAEVNPDLCVAMGAAIQGGLISGVDVGPVLVDITPHTLGIEAATLVQGIPAFHVFSPIIQRNTPLPASRSEVYGTMVDGQEAACIRVFQGEDNDTRNNQYVGEFLLEGLADVRAGNPILVRFDLDLDGILKVTAKERATGLEKQLVIDNPVARFRKSNREAAGQRLDAAFRAAGMASAPAGPSAMVGTGQVAGELPENLRNLISRCERLIAKAEEVAPKAAPDDAEEIHRLVKEILAAIAERSDARIEKGMTTLEDLVFYLQDA